MGVEVRINREVTDSKTLIKEGVKIISTDKGMQKGMAIRQLSLTRGVDAVEVITTESITRETKMIPIQSHKMHHQEETNLADKLMIMTIITNHLVMEIIRTKLKGKMKMILSLDNNVVAEVVNKEIEAMKVAEAVEGTVVMKVKEVEGVVVAAIEMILSEKQLIRIRNTQQKIH